MAEYNWYWDNGCITDKHCTSPISKVTVPSSYHKQFDKESPVHRANALQILERRIQESLNLRGKIDTGEKNLIRFLYARKFDMENSVKLVETYYLYKQAHPELFELTNSTKIAIRDGFPSVLKNRDRKGRCVLVLFGSNWDTLAYTLIDIFRALIFSLEKLTQEMHNQTCGFVIIVDWSEFTIKQASNLNPRILKMMVEYLQDCFPAKFKGIHFIAQPWYVATALTVIKPFLKEKSRNRIAVHGNNLATLHEHVPIDILPTELGGEGPPLDMSRWADQLLTS